MVCNANVERLPTISQRANVSWSTLAILKIIARLDFGQGPDCPLTLDQQGGFRWHIQLFFEVQWRNSGSRIQGYIHWCWQSSPGEIWCFDLEQVKLRYQCAKASQLTGRNSASATKGLLPHRKPYQPVTVTFITFDRTSPVLCALYWKNPSWKR